MILFIIIVSIMAFLCVPIVYEKSQKRSIQYWITAEWILGVFLAVSVLFS